VTKWIQTFPFIATAVALLAVISWGAPLQGQQTNPNQQPQAQQPAPPPPGSAQQPEQPQSPGQETPDQAQQPDANGSRVFVGTVLKQGNKYVFREAATGTTYDIDHQEEVKQFEGKRVRVHGTLDPSGKMIHLQ